jgi:hypothetical protein
VGTNLEAGLGVCAVVFAALVVALRGSGHGVAAEFFSVAFLALVTYGMTRSNTFAVSAEPLRNRPSA